MTTEKTFSAKQVASRIGTDAKTLRKFFRSKNSTYQAVGQGSRYEFPVSQLETIRRDFEKWQSNKRYPAANEKKPPSTPTVMRPIAKPKIPPETARGRELMARFPLLPGESIEARTKRIGAILGQERIDRRQCALCGDSFDDHYESKFMQEVRPRSAKGKTGCSRAGCFCQKLRDIVKT